jgi:formylglycine-generating enzyme required for sulfatase activity
MSVTQPIPVTIQVPDLKWITIPAGAFLFGEESQQTTHHLESFEIALYPVTNIQYQCFIDDGGYVDDRWWRELQKPEIENSKWPQVNRPRTNVDWNEATSFTRWLSARLKQPIRLPNELEWEKAARGEKGLEYPWGNGYEAGNANVNESSIEGGAYLGQTVAVGLYPRDESPWQVRDMAGNVLEWCNEITTDVNESVRDSSPSPAQRGGAWFDNPHDARAARRDELDPDGRYDDVGFRLLRSPPS